MNRMILNSLMMTLVVLAVSPLVIFGGYDTVPRPKPAQDMIDVLMPVPTPINDQYEPTEKTRLIYNIAKLIEAVNQQETRIKALESQVAELVKPSVEPNDVAK